jgi:CheY-like chemotaxis protein
MTAENSSEPLILIVDDHQATARSLATLLRSAGYSTDVAYSGADALAKVAAAAPLAAMIDIHLPDLNGLILSQKLRERLGPGVPLILLSGDTSMENINALSHVGATYFLSKPIHSSSLLKLMKHWLPIGDA